MLKFMFDIIKIAFMVCILLIGSLLIAPQEMVKASTHVVLGAHRDDGSHVEWGSNNLSIDHSGWIGGRLRRDHPATVLSWNFSHITSVLVSPISKKSNRHRFDATPVIQSQGASPLSVQVDSISNIPVSQSVTTSVIKDTPYMPSAMVNHYQPNADQNDVTMWQRANRNFYLMAQTSLPPSTTNGPSLLTLGTFQTLHLFAYSRQMDIAKSAVIWVVNSSDAHVITDANNWKLGNYQVTEGDFVANEPGIYTVQAYDNGIYSVPLVIVVDFEHLSSQPFSVTPTQMGIQPLSTGLSTIAPWKRAGVTFIPYPAQGNWIPVDGSTTLNVTMMNVILKGMNGQEWSYRLPVVNGQFAGLVESPFIGMVHITLFPHYFQDLTQNIEKATPYSDPLSAYTVNISGTTLDPLSQAVLASAYRDYNVAPAFALTASKLLENSPSLETAIAAISNYASSTLTYNLNELHPVNYVWQDVASAWQAHSGICEDYSNLAAAMMESVGIPTQTIEGWANGNWVTPPTSDSNPEDAHQWDQAWDGSQWIVFDPTWTTDDMSPVPDYVSNEFFTATQSLNDTHLATPSQVGTAFAGHVSQVVQALRDYGFSNSTHTDHIQLDNNADGVDNLKSELTDFIKDFDL